MFWGRFVLGYLRVDFWRDCLVILERVILEEGFFVYLYEIAHFVGFVFVFNDGEGVFLLVVVSFVVIVEFDLLYCFEGFNVSELREEKYVLWKFYFVMSNRREVSLVKEVLYNLE